MNKLCLAILGALSAAGVCATPASAEMSAAEINGHIRTFIQENPDVIVNALTRYEFEQRLRQTKEIVRDHTPTIGPDNAPITMVEFSEFQCPFCKRAQENLEKLRQQYKGRLRFAFKHLPLDFHPQAMPAAKAAQAAHRQGKFWAYSDILWENQNRLGEKLFVQAAKDLDLDLAQFNEDRASDAIEAEVNADLADAGALGARGTPFFIINGKALSGALPYEEFTAAVEDALRQTEKTN